MSKTKFYKISTLALTLSLVLGSTAFAATAKETRSEGMKTQIDTLVTGGTISQFQENAILIIANNTSDTSGLKAGLDSLVIGAILSDGAVTDGIITQAQEDAVIKISTAFEIKADPTYKDNFKVNFDGLVKSGQITQFQENAVIIIANNTSDIAGFKTGLDGLVTDDSVADGLGIMTRTQANAILELVNSSKVEK